VKNIYQTMFEIPVDLLLDLGYSPQKADLPRTARRGSLNNLYAAVRIALPCDRPKPGEHSDDGRRAKKEGRPLGRPLMCCC
jgi:hypothetical protein